MNEQQITRAKELMVQARTQRGLHVTAELVKEFSITETEARALMMTAATR